MPRQVPQGAAPQYFAEAPKPDQERESQIGHELESLQKEVAYQAECVDVLSQRMAPALSLETCQNSAQDKSNPLPNEPTCPLAAELNRLRFAVQRNNAGLQSLTRRLEL